MFTLPDVNPVGFLNQIAVYDIFFRAAAESRRTMAADPRHLGAEIGFFGVLHTWGRIYCIIHTFIFLFPVAASHQTGKAGSPAGQGSSAGSGVVAEVAGIVPALPGEGVHLGGAELLLGAPPCMSLRNSVSTWRRLGRPIGWSALRYDGDKECNQRLH